MKAISYKHSSVGKIFARCAIPSIIGMFFTSIVTIVDGIFVGKFLGPEAMAAVNLVMPIFLIIFAFAEMVAIGSSVQVSIALGKGDKKTANRVFSMCIALLVALGVVFALIFGFAGESIIRLMGADESVVFLAFEYLKPIVYLLPLILIFFSIDNYLRVCGKQLYGLIAIILTSCLNIFLDWLFVGHLGLGIGSAAWATAISFSIGALVGISPFLLGKMKLKFVTPKVSLKKVGNIFYNGSSEFLAAASGSILMLVVNAILLGIGGVVAVSAFSIVMYADNMITPILSGISGSVQPAISYNLGARNGKKIKGLVRASFITSFVLSLIFFVVIIFFAGDLVGLFSAGTTGTMLDMAKRGLLITAPGYLVVWFNIGASLLFTGINKPMFSLIIMLLQAVILPIIFISTLPNILGVDGVFFSMLIPEIIIFFCALALLIVVMKKVKKELANPPIETIEDTTI